LLTTHSQKCGNPNTYKKGMHLYGGAERRHMQHVILEDE